MTTLTNGLTVNAGISAMANWLAALNSESSYAYDGTEFTLGLPIPHTPVDPMETTNTQLTITAASGTQFTGSKTFRYERLQLGSTRAGAGQNYSLTNGQTQDSMVAQILADHNLIPAEIVVEGNIPGTPGGTAVWTLTAINNSLIYYGQMGVTVHLPVF